MEQVQCSFIISLICHIPTDDDVYSFSLAYPFECKQFSWFSLIANLNQKNYAAAADDDDDDDDDDDSILYCQLHSLL